jgi:hypothetical protein
VRQAVAWVLPYDKMYDNALYGRAAKLYGGRQPVKTIAWPQPTAYRTDVAKAKALLAEAGYANGFETTLSFDLGGATIGEPMAVLTQEALAQIGIKAQINKIPGATWRAALLKKDMPMIINRFGGWLDYPEYFFFWCYHGQNAVFNTMSYQNPKLDKIITNARFAESKPIYDSSVREMIQLAYDEVPRIPLFQPTMDVAMQKTSGLHVLVPPAAGLPATQQGLRRLSDGRPKPTSTPPPRLLGLPIAPAPPGGAALPAAGRRRWRRGDGLPARRRPTSRATCSCRWRPPPELEPLTVFGDDRGRRRRGRLARIAATDGRVNAFTAVLAERALNRACRAATRAGARRARWPACPSR